MFSSVVFFPWQRYTRVDSLPHEFFEDESEEFIARPSQLDTTQIQMEESEEEDDLVFRVPKKKSRFRKL